jgi:PadR family transcriptional regulator, regulatory protein AphA
MKLTPTSYVVLGLLRRAGKATPYELKGLVTASVGNLWSIPHSQLYAEPKRLAESGYVSEERERGGRRRRTYELTRKGRAALEKWREEPTEALPELRDLALLKLFFGADPAAIAPEQLAAHRAKLAEYEAIHAALAGESSLAGPARTLEAGIGHEREWISYWERFA